MQLVKPIIALCVMISLSQSVIGQTTALYVGPEGGLWSNSANWSNGSAPANAGGTTFNVIIPANTQVVFDLPAPTQITGISMESGSALALSDTSLEVIGVALLQNGLIEADGAAAKFFTNAPFASGESQRAKAHDGALVRLDLSKYVLSNGALLDPFVGPIMSADGTGSRLDLSSLTEVDASLASHGCCDGAPYTVRASNQGVIDLRSTATIKGAGSNEWLKFRAESGGQINLSGLKDITAGNTWLQIAGGTIDASNLKSAVNTRFDVPGGESLDLGDDFITATGSEFLIAGGGTINAPSLTNFSNSSVTLNPTTVFNVPLFTQIDNSRLHVKEGRSFAIADTKYVLSNGALLDPFVGPIMSADGTGSRLDLSSLTEVDASLASHGCCDGAPYTVRASNQGVIDLRSTATIKGAGSNEWLKFRAESGGQINLSGLKDITAGNTWLQIAGGTIDLSSLRTAVNMRIDVPVFETLALPMLTSATGSEFRIVAGGTVNAPMLTDFSNSIITLAPSTFFNAPMFTQIDNARLHAKEGRSFAVADTSYILSNSSLVEVSVGPILSADGAGSRLDLSSLTEIVANQANSGCCSGEAYTIRALNQGNVDLRNTKYISGASGDAWLKFRAESGGRIEFGSVEPTNNGVWMDVSGSGSRIVFTGDLLLSYPPGVNVPGGGGSPTIRNPQLTASLLGELHVGGNLIARISESSLHDTDGGILFMDGSGIQKLEVNGTDIGLPTEAVDNNFSWGRLVVGQETQATTVVLMDALRIPGNAPPPNALYLSGFPQGDQGLSILSGSTLVLNELNVYVGGINGDEAEWIHLNSLFGVGENRIPYDDGFLQLTVGPEIIADFDGNGEVGPADYDVWRAAFGSASDLRADANLNGIVDTADYVLWRKSLGRTALGTSSLPQQSAAIPESTTATSALLAIALLLGGSTTNRKHSHPRRIPAFYQSQAIYPSTTAIF